MAFTVTTAPLYGQGGTYTARADRLHLGSLTRFGGVQNATNANNATPVGDLAVTTTGAGNGSVSVAAGHVWLKGASGYGAYYAYNDAASTVGPLSANASGNPRLDLIVVRVSDTGVGAPTVAFAVLTGTPAATPAAPTPTVSSTTVEVPLASVYVANGFTTSTTIAAGDINDYRTKHGLPNFAVGDDSTRFVPSPLKGDLIYDSLYSRWKSHDGTNWVPLQAAPVLCASSTRPGTSARFEGMKIYETDTNYELVFDGTNWRYSRPIIDTFNITFAGGGTVTGTVTYPVTFASAAYPIAVSNAITDNIAVTLNIFNRTTTTFDYWAYIATGGTYTGTIAAWYYAFDKF